MSAHGQMRAGPAVLFIAPVILLAGLAAHPFVHSYLDGGASRAAAVAGAPSRWAWSHLLIALGLGLLLVAVTITRHRLRDAGEQRWSVVALPLLLAGGALLGASVGSEITLAAVATSGQDVLATLVAGEHTTTPLHFGGALMFAAGWVCLAVALHRGRILPRAQTWVATAALAVVAGALFVPQTSAAHAHGAALVVANWLIGYHTLTDKARTAPAATQPGHGSA